MARKLSYKEQQYLRFMGLKSPIKPVPTLGWSGILAREDAAGRQRLRDSDLSIFTRLGQVRVEFRCLCCRQIFICRIDGTEEAAYQRYRNQICDNCRPAAEQPAEPETEGPTQID